jgi:hypothetical protein
MYRIECIKVGLAPLLELAWLNLAAVRKCNPNLPEIPDILDELNQTRDVNAFIRGMRQAFVDSVS